MRKIHWWISTKF